jgi:hypothetical protein
MQRPFWDVESDPPSFRWIGSHYTRARKGKKARGGLDSRLLGVCAIHAARAYPAEKKRLVPLLSCDIVLNMPVLLWVPLALSTVTNQLKLPALVWCLGRSAVIVTGTVPNAPSPVVTIPYYCDSR